MRTLNLGILAHVDAGKTSLTERLLYAVGVIDEPGRVDDGTTQTDSLALERQRGITIRSAVVSFVIDDVTVNLIDTPGHPDFIAEVERALGVLDGVVLVVSAVEGVQAQTLVLWRTLQTLRLPTLLFVNKIDRGGARRDQVLQDISERLTPAIIPMGSTRELGTGRARSIPYAMDDPSFMARLTDTLADHDDAVLRAYVADGSSDPHRLREGLAAQTKLALVHPVFFGSAITGAGVGPLIAAIPELLPATDGDDEGPVSGAVFKVERGPAGEKIAYVRMFSGSVRTRDRLPIGRNDEQKVTSIQVFERGSAVQHPSIVAGQIGKLWGLSDVRVGDTVGPSRTDSDGHHFAPPTLETIVVPREDADRGALHVALSSLAEQDPLIHLRQDEIRQELSVSLYGEVQKEVIQDTLANDFGIDVGFRDTTTICIERPAGTGAALERIGAAGNPFLATVGVRIQPAELGSGVAFLLEVELGSLPLSFQTAIEASVRGTLREGLRGWQVTDCCVTLTHTGYWSTSSTAGDFRNLTPLVLMRALDRAGTTVCEPIHRFRLEIPSDTLGTIFPALAQLRAIPDTPSVRGSFSVVEGEISAARMDELRHQVPALTRGEGALEFTFDRYRAVRGTVPTRPRTDLDPLNREAYLLHLGGRF
jgi:ribosomal protection tetracycline resistance protein